MVDTTSKTRYNKSNSKGKGNRMIIVRTETWTTKQGEIAKAVVRDEKGRILGASNQTQSVPVPVVSVGIVGK